MDLGRLLHDRVGHRLADDDPRDLRDHVVQALDVLHVERRVDVNPRVEELLHVLPPFRVAAALGVRVGELVDEEDLRVPLERRVEVELLDGDAPVLDPLAGQDRQAEEQRPGVVAAVGLDHADDDVALLLFELGPGRLEHGVCLSDAGSCAEEDLQLATPGLALLLGHLPKELVGVGPLLGHPAVATGIPSSWSEQRRLPRAAKELVRTRGSRRASSARRRRRLLLRARWPPARRRRIEPRHQGGVGGDAGGERDEHAEAAVDPPVVLSHVRAIDGAVRSMAQRAAPVRPRREPMACASHRVAA